MDNKDSVFCTLYSLTKQKRPTSLRELLTNRYFVVITALLLFFVLDAPLNVALLVMGTTREDPIQYLAIYITSVVFWSLMVVYFIVRVSSTQART